VGWKRVMEKWEGGGIWLMHFLYLYKNRTTKSNKIVLSRGEADEGE
jgi:hypothetical protein